MKNHLPDIHDNIREPTKDEVSQAIKDIDDMRLTHRQWMSYIERGHATDEEIKIVGPLEKHKMIIRQYDHIIACLQAYWKVLNHV